MIAENEEDQTPSLRVTRRSARGAGARGGEQRCGSTTSTSTSLRLLFITVSWIENTVARVSVQEAFIEDHWDHEGNGILINGRIRT